MLSALSQTLLRLEKTFKILWNLASLKFLVFSIVLCALRIDHQTWSSYHHSSMEARRKDKAGGQTFYGKAKRPFDSKKPVRYFDAPPDAVDNDASESPAYVRKKKTFDSTADFVAFDDDVSADHPPNTQRKQKQNERQKPHVFVEPEVDPTNHVPTPRNPERRPNDVPVIPKEKLKKFNRGKALDVNGLRTNFHKKLLRQREKKVQFSKRQAARTEILHTEASGFLEVEDSLEDTARVTQKELSKTVDIQSQAKNFDLQLNDFGPYGFQYTRNGRHLMLFGKQGHVATMDWITKKLMCEFHVQESIACGQWLHQETMMALGQKQWVNIYDSKGVELHCIKKLFQVLTMDFLPYHFLLATGSERGYLSWLDISVGQMVSQFNTKNGRLAVMKKNPSNAVMHLGHSNGTVSLWSPNVPEPLVKFLSHHTAVRALDVDASGRYMATTGNDRRVKIWDLRKYQTVQELDVFQSPVSMDFSQRGLLAIGMDKNVQIYKDVGLTQAPQLYMQHYVKNGLRQVEFCPYEDVVGCGFSEGFSSLLIPGSGEAHFDAIETNPFQSKRQRQEMEVHSLLEKIPSELIGLDSSQIGRIHEPSLQETLEQKARTLFVNVPKVEFTPKYKALGGSAGWTKRKETVREEKKRQQIKQAVAERKKLIETMAETEEEAEVPASSDRPRSVFDRFIKKNVNA